MSSLTFYIIFVFFLAFLLLAINLIFAPSNPYQEKNSAFECGFHSFLGQNRTQFSISFFIFALLFLLFDLEILLVYPYVVSAYSNGIYGLLIMLIFFLILTLGFAFELGKKALNIDTRQTSSFKDNTKKVSFVKITYNNVSLGNSKRFYSTGSYKINNTLSDTISLFNLFHIYIMKTLSFLRKLISILNIIKTNVNVNVNVNRFKMFLSFLVKSFYIYIDGMLNTFSDTINYKFFIILLSVIFLIFITISFIYCLFYLIHNLNKMSYKNMCVGYGVLDIINNIFSMILVTILKAFVYLATKGFDPVRDAVEREKEREREEEKERKKIKEERDEKRKEWERKRKEWERKRREWDEEKLERIKERDKKTTEERIKRKKERGEYEEYKKKRNERQRKRREENRNKKK